MDTTRAPMSERQQLALIKQLERSSEMNNQAVDMTSPPRAPLQVVNGPSHGINLRNPNSSSGTFSNTTSPNSTGSRTPGEERLRRKILRRNEKGETQLHLAAIRGSSKVAEKLLISGIIDPNVTDNAGWTPLHEACNRGQLSVAKVLVKYGADVNMFGGPVEQREPPLHDAARNGHVHIVKFLARKGALLTATKEDGSTPLDEAKISKTTNPNIKAVIKFLTEHQEKQVLSFIESEESDCEEEGGDLVKFLGIANSPSIEQALQALGITELEDPLSKKKVSSAKKKKSKNKFSSKGRLSSSTARQICLTMEDKNNSKETASSSSLPTLASSTATSNETSIAREIKIVGMEEASHTFSSDGTKNTESTPEGGDAEAKEVPANTTLTPLKEKVPEKRIVQTVSVDNEDDEVRKKKYKKDDNPTMMTVKDTSGKRTTRGNSSEKTMPGASSASASMGSSSGEAKAVKSMVSSSRTRGTVTSDHKSPTSQANSTINSPKKDDDNSGDESSKKASDFGPKVPPLKIVLSGNGNTSPSNQIPYESECGGKKVTTSPPIKEEENISTNANSNIKKVDEKDEPSPSLNSGIIQQAIPDSSINSVDKTASTSILTTAPSRLTRSRANQNTPGLENSNEHQGNLSETSSGNAQDNSSSNERPEKSNYTEYHVKKRKLRSQVDDQAGPSTSNSRNGSNSLAGSSTDPLSDIQKYLNLRRTVEQRRKNLFPVHPKPPEGFKDYLMNKKTYLLQSNAHERLRTMPMLQPPPSLEGPLKNLFIEQEKDRYQLRKKHQVEKEKLVLTVEQEIIRLHGRAARALANQPYPYSVCTILKDEEIYTPIDSQLDEKTRDIRSRYNGRLFLSWLEDVDDKWEKIKEQMVLRHHNEAESLNAVQKMDWEWKLQELNGRSSNSDNFNLKVDDLYIPMVHVSDDFDLSDNR